MGEETGRHNARGGAKGSSLAGQAPFPTHPRLRHGGGMTRFLLTAALLSLAACSSSDQPTGLSAEENRQLNEAAAMLDANAVDLNAMAPSGVDEEIATDNES